MTSRCEARCRYCPRSSYHESWRGRDLPLDVVESLEPVFERTEMVYFQGWGEPLVHPDLVSMIRVAKRAGARAGTTSNGHYLGDATIESLLEAGLDVLGLSLAGTTDAEHARWRPDIPRRTVLEAFERVRVARDRRGGAGPRLHAALLLFRSAQSALEAQLEALADAGVDEVVVSSLTFVPDPALEEEAQLADDPQQLAELLHRLSELGEAYAGRGLRVYPHIASRLAPQRACPENIERALVVGSDGRVYPCVLTGLPVRGSPRHWVHGTQCFAEPLGFGSLREAALPAIWSRGDYRRFRGQFRRGRLDPRCACCLKRFVIETPAEESAAAPPPIPDLP